jgi:single stranded DNA-binding protein
MNNCSFVGRIAIEPDLRYTPAGTAVCSFRVAVKRAGREAGTDFINVVCWNHNATFAGNYLAKGRLISFTGRLQIKQWQKAVTIGTETVMVRMETPEIIITEIRALDKNPQIGGTDVVLEGELVPEGSLVPA